MPIARERPIRSPRLPSTMPPIAAPSINAAVKRANQSPPDVGVKSSPKRLFETESDATGIRPSSMPSNTRPSDAATRTATRADDERGGGTKIHVRVLRTASTTALLSRSPRPSDSARASRSR
jgi:hypothetical protein